MSVLPNFLGIGAQRCATSWLDVQLRKHPSIFLPARRKEVHFFDRYYDRGMEWYLDFFHDAGVNHKAIGEITPGYLFYPDAPSRIRTMLPGVRLIAILRNPADRAYSQFGLLTAKGKSSGSFEKFLEDHPRAFARGLYYEQLKRYLDQFAREQMLVLIFEELVANRLAAISKICEFLGVDASFFRNVDLTERLGESRRPRYSGLRRLIKRGSDVLRARDMDWVVNLGKKCGLQQALAGHERIPPCTPDTRHRLLGKYADDIRRLETLLRRSLDEWFTSPA